MKKGEIVKIEEYLFARLSDLYSEHPFIIDFPNRSIRTSFHGMSFCIYGKYNNYFTIRPTINLVSSRISRFICDIFDINDEICFHSLFNKGLIQMNQNEFWDRYHEGFMFHKITSKEDIDLLVLEHEKFMQFGGSAFIRITSSLHGIEIFLNEKISKHTIAELCNPELQSDLRKFYRDLRIIRSGIIARYIINRASAEEIVYKFKTLFSGVEMVLMTIDKITNYFDKYEVDSF